MGFGSITRMYSVTITQVIENQSLAKKLTLCKTQSVWILSITQLFLDTIRATLNAVNYYQTSKIL